MSSRSLNEILIKIPTELFNFIFAAYNLRFILPLVVYIHTQRDDVRRIQQRCFMYRSIFAIPTLHKRRVQGHCAAYHFRQREIVCPGCISETVRCRKFILGRDIGWGV